MTALLPGPPVPVGDAALVIEAPDGAAQVWPPPPDKAPRGVWIVTVTATGAHEVRVAWLRPESGCTYYLCDACGPFTTRRGCPHVIAATNAADLYRAHTRDGRRPLAPPTEGAIP